jgi:RNA polymerase sigma-70 factor, ECF subfamily
LFLSLFAKPDPDAPLVAAAGAGDARAFDALVYRYQSRVMQFVRARLDSAVDAEDVAQEVFVAAWRQLPGFRGRSRFKTWLFGIALNLCAEAGRRHLRLKMVLGGLNGPLEVSSPEDYPREWDPFEWSLAEAERTEIRRRLAELPEPERQALELYYYAELNLPEISQLLQVNLSTLKYRFYQAHRRLRARLEEQEAGGVHAGLGRERR